MSNDQFGDQPVVEKLYTEDKKPRRPRMSKQSVLKFRDWMDIDGRYLLKPVVIQEKYKTEENVDLLLNFIRTTKRSMIQQHRSDIS